MLCRTIIARTMALASGAKIGAYEVLAPLGAAGMGEVYRARDTKLDRDVALKILPESFATDPDRSMRCQHEAKTEVKGGGLGNIDHF
jgi:eukaryotic-like serine/threonine-protein kinase